MLKDCFSLKVQEPIFKGRASIETLISGGEIGVVEAHALGGQLIDVWRANMRMAIRAAVVPIHVVGDDEDDVGLLTLCFTG